MTPNEDPKPMPIKDFEDYYIYPDGKVWSTKTNRFLAQKINTSGYASVVLSQNGQRKDMRINRLVALHFVPNDDPQNKTIVNHLDENKLNNNYTNLEWCTWSYNNNYGTKPQRIATTLSQKVIMCNKDTLEEIQTFNSMKEAAAFFKSNNATHIGEVLKGTRKTAYGYFWKKEEKKDG